MESLNWGIIGPGKIAHDFAHDLALIKPAQKITAVLGIDPAATHEFANTYSIESVYAGLHEFINHQGLDIVYIATPHPQHFKEAMACLQEKIPVLCEKPLTLNAEQATELIKVSRKMNCFLMEAMWIRFLPGIRQLLQLIKEGNIGKILSIKASMGYKAPSGGDNRYFNPELGGGSLLDLGIYPVFLAHLLLGKPTAVKAFGSLTEKGIDKSCAVLLDYTGDAQAILDSTLVSQSNRPAEIAGEKGIIRIQHPWFEKSPGIELELYNQEKKIFPTAWEGHGLQFEIEEVITCLQNKKIESDLYPHSFSRALSETMDTIRDQIGVVYKHYE